MKHITVTLKSFLYKYFKKSKKSIDEAFHISKSSIQFIQKLYSHMIKSHLEWLKIEYIKEVKYDNKDSFPKGNQYSGIPIEIRNKIETESQQTKIYEFDIKYRKFRIFFVYNRDSLISEKEIRVYLQKIYMWLYISNIYSPINCAKRLDIYLYLTNLKKKLPRIDLEPFDMNHANTGYTNSCMDNDIKSPILIQKNEEQPIELTIFREEEWFKVFIHETFHCMGLDFSHMYDYRVEENIHEFFHLINAKNIRLYESYTEECAELIHTIFVSHFSLINTKHLMDMEYTYKKIEEAIKLELFFSLFQKVKILDHFGLKYFNLYDNSNESRDMCKKYNENTPILAYYILKPIQMFNVNKFIDWINNHNKGLFQFTHSKENINNYVLFFKENYANSAYISILKNIEEEFVKIKGDSKLHTELETLRMTMLEI